MNIKNKKSFFWSILYLLSTGAASTVHATELRFDLRGTAIFYNSSITSETAPSPDITNADAEELALLLMENPIIDTLVINSEGGDTEAAEQMAEKVFEFGLATEVRALCLSACPLIFMAGQKRKLAQGGMLGFHRASTTYKSVEEAFGPDGVYDGSDTPPGVVAYDVAVDGAVSRSRQLRRWGISQDFVIELLSISPREMWFPTRDELANAGVIDEE